MRCRDPRAAYQFRYDGLTLMLESGAKYVLVPRDWSQGGAAAIVLPESDTTRLEFYSSAEAPAPATCAACPQRPGRPARLDNN